MDFDDEVAASSRDLAQKRSTEAVELLEARDLADRKANDGAEYGSGGGGKKSIALERTKFLAAVSIAKMKLAEGIADVVKESDDIVARLQKHYEYKEDGDAQEEHEGLEMENHMKELARGAKVHLEGSKKNELDELETQAKQAGCGTMFKALSSSLSQLLKSLRSDAKVKEFYSQVGKDKKFLSNAERQQTKKKREEGAAEQDVQVEEKQKVPVFSVIEEVSKNENNPKATVSSTYFEAKAGVRASWVSPSAGKDPHEALRGMACVKKAIKDIEANIKKTGNSIFTNTFIQGTPASNKVVKQLKKDFNDQLLTRLILPDEDWAKKIFAP